MDLPFDPIARAAAIWERRFGDSVAMAAVTSIMRVQQILIAELDGILKPYGLTFARYEALVLLSFTRSGKLPLGKMGQRLMIHPTSVTNVVDRLAEDRLVERVPHPSDRRATLAQITPAGRALAQQASEAVNEIRFGVAALTPGQMHQVVETVRHLRLSALDFEL